MLIVDRYLARAVSVSIAIGVWLFASAGVCSAQDQNGQVSRLEMGKPIERQLEGGELHVYTLRLSAGEFFEVCVDRLGAMVDVAVYSPEGRRVAEGDAV